MRVLRPRTGLAAAIAVLSLVVMGGVAMAGDVFSRYLLRSGEQPGFSVTGQVAITRDVAAYLRLHYLTRTQARATRSLLTHAGYAGGAQELLSGRGGRQGFSLVGTFTRASGPAAVRDYLAAAAYQGENDGRTRLSKFRIAGVASARGITAFRGAVATSNVYWTQGRCVLASGLYLPSAAHLTAGEVSAAVVTGVRAQRTRTHGHCR